MRCRSIGRIVRATLPVDDRRARQAFPPGLVVRGQRDVGIDRVVLDRGERVRVGLLAGAGSHAEIAGLRVDRMEAAIGTGFHPADIVADRPHFPARPAQTLRRNQHRQIGLAASGRERRCNVVRFALWIFHADDQHMLGQPAFLARLPAGDAQRVALLAEQRIAAVARTDRLDRQFLREMHDEALVRIELADRMQTFHERFFALAASGPLGTLALDARERRRSHARHQPHVGDDVGRVGDLHATARDRRIDRAHAIRNHVQRAALHAAIEQRVDFCVRLRRRHPVIVRTGIVLVRGADEGQMLDARNIGRMRAVQPAVRMRLRVQRDQRAIALHLFDECALFGFGAVAPMDSVRLRESRDIVDPAVQCVELAGHGGRRTGARLKEDERTVAAPCGHCKAECGKRRCALQCGIRISMKSRM